MTYLLTFIFFVIAVILLALGTIIANKRLRGSCGGVQVIGPDGESLSCATCPNRNKNPDCQSKK